MPVEHFARLQPATRFLGVLLPGDGMAVLQWSTDPLAPSQKPENAYELSMPEREAWRLLVQLSMAYDQRGRPPLPED